MTFLDALSKTILETYFDLVDSLIEFNEKLSNWIVFKGGFKTDNEIRFSFNANSIMENNYARKARLFFGDQSAKKANPLMRAFFSSYFDDNVEKALDALAFIRKYVIPITSIIISSLILVAIRKFGIFCLPIAVIICPFLAVSFGVASVLKTFKSNNNSSNPVSDPLKRHYYPCSNREDCAFDDDLNQTLDKVPSFLSARKSQRLVYDDFNPAQVANTQEVTDEMKSNRVNPMKKDF